MRDCAQCGKPVDGPICLGCGYSDTPAERAPRDPLAGCCEFMDRGWRCTAPGSVSNGTHGGGPWYCRQHIDLVRGYAPLASREAIDPAGKARVDAAIAAIAQKLRTRPTNPRQWAHDILRMAGEGTYTYAYGIECAKRVVAMESISLDPEAAAERRAIQGERASDE